MNRRARVLRPIITTGKERRTLCAHGWNAAHAALRDIGRFVMAPLPLDSAGEYPFFPLASTLRSVSRRPPIYGLYGGFVSPHRVSTATDRLRDRGEVVIDYSERAL